LSEDRALTVSEAMGLAKHALEGMSLRVIGEVSEATDKPGYKAVYFTLCDGPSVMSCLVWRDAYEASGVQLRVGMQVEVAGTLTVYAPKGRMQFQVRRLAAAGEGVLRMQVAALARRLEAEGLMRPERKRVLPPFPARIGLVTSPRGKAVHDVLRTLKRRFPAAEVVLAGVAVEGAEAVDSIVAALSAVGAAPGVEVVIVARGGGSYEDLMPFNDERVARAIVGCPVPVVTGIGHEPDTTIADMVADLRASTPTAAAESAAPAAEEVAARLTSLGRLLAGALLRARQGTAHRLALLARSRALTDPRALLAQPSQRLDLAAEALSHALPARLALDRARLGAASSSLARVAPRLAARDRARLDLARAALGRSGPLLMERSRAAVGALAAQLEDLSPLGILGRGYAVCYAEDGRTVVRSAKEFAPGERVRVRVRDGAAACSVESVELEPEQSHE
jgi:exodeoxyribonuclease VII large subunit